MTNRTRVPRRNVRLACRVSATAVLTALAVATLAHAQTTAPQYWDGQGPAGDNHVDGGSGSWTTAGAHWTDAAGAAVAPPSGGLAIFGTTGGAVTVTGAQSATGLQFLSDGYVLRPDASGSLTLVGGISSQPSNPIIVPGSTTDIGPQPGTGDGSGIYVVDGATARLDLAVHAQGDIVRNGSGTLVIGNDLDAAGGFTALEGATRFENGAQVDVSGALLTQAQIEIAGPGTTMRANSLQTLLLPGGHGEIRVDDGAAVSARTAYIGYDGILHVDGPGTRLNIDTEGTFLDELKFGTQSAGYGMFSGGAAVTDVTGTVGDIPFVVRVDGVATDWSRPESVVQVTGSGTVWSNTGYLGVGNAGGRGRVVVADGATVSGKSVGIGGGYSATAGLPAVGGTGVVDVGGAGSLLRADESLDLGLYSGDGTLILHDGGAVTAPAVTLAKLGAGSSYGPAPRALLAIGGGVDDSGTPLAALAPGTLTAGSLTFGPEQATLLFNHTDSAYGFAVPMSGPGHIVNAAGTTILTGDSLAFSGQTDVTGGLLQIDGPLGGTVKVAGGGTVRGTGMRGALDLAGTLAGDGQAAVTRLSGDLTVRPGAVLGVDVGGTGADRFDVGGHATLEGGTVTVTTLDPDSAYVNGTVHTLISASGGVTGQFEGLDEDSAFLDFTLGYSANAVTLTVNTLMAFPDVAETFNQVQAAGALAALDASPGSDSLAVSNRILMMDAASARAAFDDSSGEIYSTLQDAGLRDAMAFGGRLGARATQRLSPGWSAWAGVSGGGHDLDGDGNGAASRSSGSAAEAGVQYEGIDHQWSVGAAVERAGVSTRLTERHSRANGDATSGGVYARLGDGGPGFLLTAALAWRTGEARVRRNMDFSGDARSAVARVDLSGNAVALEGRYGWALAPGVVAGPLVSVDQGRVRRGRVAETGADSLNLSGDAATTQARRFGLGGFVQWNGSHGGLMASLRYVEAGDGETATSGLSLQGAPGSRFDVRAADTVSDGLRLALSGWRDLGGGWSLEGDAMVQNDGRARAVGAGIRLRRGF